MVHVKLEIDTINYRAPTYSSNVGSTVLPLKQTEGMKDQVIDSIIQDIHFQFELYLDIIQVNEFPPI
jgi:hypothetical protein